VSLPERLGESVAQMDLWPLRRAMLVLWRKARLCESALTSAPILRASRAAACPGLSFIPAGVRMQPSNGLPPPSPPTEKATAREDQAGTTRQQDYDAQKQKRADCGRPASRHRTHIVPKRAHLATRTPVLFNRVHFPSDTVRRARGTGAEFFRTRAPRNCGRCDLRLMSTRPNHSRRQLLANAAIAVSRVGAYPWFGARSR
jgi:hypothetical protein